MLDGKGGVQATDVIAPMETIARIPRSLLLQPIEVQCEGKAGWAASLTAAALVAQNDECETPVAAQFFYYLVLHVVYNNKKDARRAP